MSAGALNNGLTREELMEVFLQAHVLRCSRRPRCDARVIFDRMTALDLIGVYDPLTRLKSMNFVPEFHWRICAFTETVSDDRGLRFMPDMVAGSLGGYDLIVVPGGFGTRALQHDKAFIEWLRSAGPVKLKTSVCTGALLYGRGRIPGGKTRDNTPECLRGIEDLLRSRCR